MLTRIVAQKKIEVHQLKTDLDLTKVIPRTDRIDLQAIFNRDLGRVAVIAELKKASPVNGVLCADFDPLRMAKTYAQNGAAALSVISDRVFFQGSPAFLQELRPGVDLPILRKDFIIDELQLYETVLLGADLVLLIAALHDYASLLHLSQKCVELGIEPLVEVHNREELKKVIDLPVKIIGVNNRNLKDFTVDIRTSLELADDIPDSFIKVSESGIKSPADMQRLAGQGFNAALIGEALVSSPDPGAKLKALVNYEQG